MKLYYQLKFEITLFLGMQKGCRIFHNCFGLPTLSKTFSSNNACSFDAVKFSAVHLAFLHNFLLLYSLALLDSLENLSFELNFSSTFSWNKF